MKSGEESPDLLEKEITLEQAGILARAMVAQLCDELGVRAIIIKGRAGAFHGLLRPRVSADIDVLTDREGVRRLVAELEERGWSDRPWDDPDRIFPQHSFTYFHPKWPVDIDLHYRFPGLEAPEARVMEILQADAVHVVEAGTAVPISGLLSTALIALVHCLRRPHESRSIEELTALKDRLPHVIQGDRLVRLADSVGALAAIRPFIEEVFPENAPQEWPQPSRDWVLYSTYVGAASIRVDWLMKAPLRERPRLLWHAFWPSRNALGARDIRALNATRGTLVLMRLQRLGEALVNGRALANDVLRRTRADYVRSSTALGDTWVHDVHHRHKDDGESGS